MKKKEKIETMNLILSLNLDDTIGFTDGKKHYRVVRDDMKYSIVLR
jgi:hypothetical protein